MHFGLRLPSFALGDQTASLTAMGVYLRRAEDLGFDSAMLIDHLLVAPPAYSTTWLEPITLLAALSGVTRTIKLGHARARAPVPRARPVRQAVGDARPAVGRAVDPRRRRRLDGGGVRGRRDPAPRARRPDERAARADHRAVDPGPRHVRGSLLPGPRPVDRPEARPAAAPADLDRWRDAAVREDLRPARADRGARPAPDREVREDVGPPHLRDGRDGRPRLERPAAATWPSTAASPRTCRRSTRTSCTSCEPGQRPEDAAPLFRVYCGMDLEYWQQFYLLGEAEQVAERIRAKIEALGGVDHLMLNPLNWDPANLELLASDVLPRVTDYVARPRRPAPAVPPPRPTRRRPALLAEEPRLVLAGGTDVYPAYASRPIDRPVLDITALPGLRGVTDDGDGWRHPRADHVDRPRGGVPAAGVRRAARRRPGRSAGDRSRTWGRCAGNVVNASPASDGMPNLLALDAAVEFASARRRPAGARWTRSCSATARRTSRPGRAGRGLRVPQVEGGRPLHVRTSSGPGPTS